MDYELEESKLEDLKHNIRQVESEYNFTRSMVHIR